MTLTGHAITITPARRLRGTLDVPGDKSISHRYALIAALSSGRSRISGFAPGADCASTLACLEALGVEIRPLGRNGIEIVGRGLRGLRPAAGSLDAGNSGTTMRLLAGVLAAHPFSTTILGDASLSRRPMRRVVEPLSRMGARFETAEGGRPPLHVHGADLRAIEYDMPVASAQVKSAILLAGLHADGTTAVRELVPTRDHTERALRAFGIDLQVDDRRIEILGGQRPTATSLHIPGDPSSAAFFGIAAAGLRGSDVRIAAVGLNPTRIGWIEVLRRSGARVEVSAGAESGGEPEGQIRVGHGGLAPIRIDAAEAPAVIDELPAFAALATHGGEILVTGAGELRAKESDRITALVSGLRALGADAEELADGFVVRGSTPLRGGTADAAGDHRLAMAFAIAALGGRNPSTILGAEAVAISYPGFFEALQRLTGPESTGPAANPGT
jgi:3-phosphoshikimate 1-carboxyvinyltransferase